MENTVKEINIQSDRVSQGYANVQRVKAELKRWRTIAKDTCIADRQYFERRENIKTQQIANKQRAHEIVGQEVKEKIKTLSHELKAEKEYLSDWLKEYAEATQMKTVSIQDSLFEIVPEYKLVTRNA